MFDTKTLLILIPALPFAAAILTAILGPRFLKRLSHLPVIIAIAGSFLASVGLLRHFQASRPNVPVAEAGEGGGARIGFEEVFTLWNWANVDDAYAYTGLPSGSDDPQAARSYAGGMRPFRIDIALRVDPLTIMMLLMVNFVATLVAVYAAGYMEGDRGYWRFFAYISLFVFCMNMLVTVSNFLLLFVFWEGVGACSYLLIGFWFEKPAAAAAGKKAFLVNRVGDFGFALAMFFLWTTYGTLNFHDTTVGSQEISGILGQSRLASNAFIGGGLGLTICLSLLVGACGKSAQLPLHVWLADAMEGPTPVSALIHAATMVTAGVYMVARCTPLFMASPTAQLTVACVGAATALVAGFIALTQWDLKRVLAYSTISQLGYMFLALGTGTLAGITAGLFHLFTHAFFKALLFLGAGSVMHSMGHVIDMRRFSGLRRIMPITHATFAIGCLALAGIVPFAGFWSKDAILGAVHDQAAAMSLAATEASSGSLSAGDSPSHEDAEHTAHGDHHPVVTTAHLAGRSSTGLARSARIFGILYYIGLLSAFMTAVYTFRAFFVTFYGDLKVPEEAGHHAHESPPLMWVPLAILAVFAAGVGLVLHRSEWLLTLLEYTPSLATQSVRQTPLPGVFHWNVAVTSTLGAIAGVAVAAYLYLGNLDEVRALSHRLSSPWIGSPYLLSRGKMFFDELYGLLIVKPLLGFAALSAWLDRYLVDSIVDLVGKIPKFIGGFLRPLQSGFVPFYGMTMVVLAMLIWGVRLLWGAF
jgi:NADH-quinone oxidoreductase subunit L